MTRDLRPEENEVLRDALRQAGVEPTDPGAAGSTPGENIATFFSLLIAIAIVSYVSYQVALLWVAGSPS